MKRIVIPFCRLRNSLCYQMSDLHIPPVLTADFEEGLGDLP